MIVCGQLPGDIIVGFAAVLGITLRREQVYRVVSVGLVETHDVSAGGIVAVFQFQFLLRASYLDVLTEQAANHLRDPRAVTLTVGNQKRVWRFVQAFLPGIPALLIKIAEHRFRTAGAVVERGQRCRFPDS